MTIWMVMDVTESFKFQHAGVEETPGRKRSRWDKTPAQEMAGETPVAGQVLKMV